MIRKILVAMCLTLTMLLPVACLPSAEASVASWCDRHYILKGNTWGQTINVKVLPPWLGNDEEPGRAALTVGYKFCRVPGSYEYVSPSFAVVCFTSYSHHKSLGVFVGLKANFVVRNRYKALAFLDDVRVTIPARINYGDTHCGRAGFGSRPWTRASFAPAWKANYWERTVQWPDQEHATPNWRYFGIRTDPEIKPF